MKIIANKRNELIECRLPNGKIVEITMVSVEGEEVFVETDIHEAVRLVHQSLSMLGAKFK